MADKKKVVIIGGGPAGRIICHVIHGSPKRDEYDVKLIKFEEVNVNRCAIPYGVNGKKPIQKYIIPNTLVTNFGAELIVDRATKVDKEKKIVHTVDHGDYPYDFLVLATGAQPCRLPIPGLDAKNVIMVRSIADLKSLREWTSDNKRKAAVIGGGYIGLEIAVEMKKSGLDVSVIEMLPHVLLATTENEFVIEVEKHAIEKGLNIKTDSRLVKVEKNENNIATHLELASGEKIETDFVVFAVGVSLDTSLAEAAGLEVSQFGIRVNEKMQCLGHEDIYSAGDCTEKISFVSKNPTRGEFGTNAAFMGRVVGQNILGKDIIFPGVINANVSTCFDLSFGSAGLIEKMAVSEGIEVITGYSEVLDGYPMIDNVTPVKTKLVFDKKTKELIGGSVLRTGRGETGTASNVDFISFAIQMKAKLSDLFTLQYSTHPELAAKPSDNTILFAVKDAMKKL